MIWYIMCTKTANGKYMYDMKVGNYDLRTLVQMTHKHNCEESGWTVAPLKEGCFGFDNLAVCIGYANCTAFDPDDIDSLSNIIHEAWIMNYTYWRDNKPWLNGYIKPAKPLNDERRNSLALLSFPDLPEDEQEKDRILARYLTKYLL